MCLKKKRERKVQRGGTEGRYHDPQGHAKGGGVDGMGTETVSINYQENENGKKRGEQVLERLTGKY